ncbi:hypothetical protein RvY_02091-1 [Ramazzottius varieornatus]|uniref:Uncharacterized protein n=1 Tax=Ramazzottius varieornatus TaxID=947166 RepID=A0A1D1UPH5_RAMVA|nr:hypothetical protein RvY_02091-1 [Ramazzottius varieornatus]
MTGLCSEKITIAVLFGFITALYLSFFHISQTISCAKIMEYPKSGNQTEFDSDFSVPTYHSLFTRCEMLLQFGYEASRKLWRPYDCSMATYAFDQLADPMEALKKATSRSRVGVLLIGDSRMRQLQIALYKHFANRSDFTTEMPSDVFCDRHDLHEYSYLNGTLQSCEFERIVEPHKLALARWWIPFAEHTTVQRRLETLLESGVKSMPHIVIFSAGLWLVRDCSSNFIPFGECMIRFER